jgi:hypothetical protein
METAFPTPTRYSVIFATPDAAMMVSTPTAR